jgi:RNA polymerase sigma-70 factor (ECF subfamily)
MKKVTASKELSENDRQTFHHLYQKHHRLVYSICLRMTGNGSEAEDLTQDVFVQLFRTIGSFRAESSFTTWLHRLTVNCVLMQFRKRKKQRKVFKENGELPAYVIAGIADPGQVRIVERILLSEVVAKLPTGYRQAVVLHDIEGLDHNEIAEKTGRSIGTSKSQLHKGRETLRQLIAGQRQPPNRPPVASHA